ncbi:MAG: sugar ABC transporter permease [Bifidobacteriaceae bacterium]|jgi:putative multiple sugar transport system permease protein|nr:sugar ABC transporter permease [Bifidobacteriaceae bacterium]
MNIADYLKGNLRQYGILGALVLIFIFFVVMSGGKLLNPNNISSLVQQVAYVAVLSIGMVTVIVAGHIDLSVGSVVAFIGAVVGQLMYTYHVGWPVAVLAALIVGLLVGAWQGIWVAIARIPAFIVTLSSMLLFRGLAVVTLGAKTLSGFPEEFSAISKGGLPKFVGTIDISSSALPTFFRGEADVFTLLIGAIAIVGLVYSSFRTRAAERKHGLTPIPLSLTVGKLVLLGVVIAFFTYLVSLSRVGTPIVLIIVAVLIVVYTFVQNRTVYGRHVYAIGGNLNAAILSGVNTRRVNFAIFLNMGVLTGICAVIVTARLGAATPTAGNGYELDAIAACFIGGAAVTGGVGKVSGAMIGALIMGLLTMGLSILGVNESWQMVVKGLVLLAAVILDLFSKRRSVLAEVGQR